MLKETLINSDFVIPAFAGMTFIRRFLRDGAGNGRVC